MNCGPDAASLCGLVHDVTGNRRAGVIAEALLGTPTRILGILLAALVIRLVLNRVIERVAERVAAGRSGLGRIEERLPGAAAAVLGSSPLLSERRAQRARTLASVLKSVSTGLVGTVAVLMILAELGFSLAPVLASAGIAGVALGFGAQTLVKDFLSGMFMIVEDQYGVGDSVDLGEAAGTVEGVGLRVTRVRDVEGTVWHVRNGEIVRVGNRSQGWARAVLDVTITYGEDVERVKALMLDVARECVADPSYAPLVLEEPEMWGIEAMTTEGVVLRMVVKTVPLQQWAVARELRRRIKERFDAEGVEVPLLQRTVVLRPDTGYGNGGDNGNVSRPEGGRPEAPTR